MKFYIYSGDTTGWVSYDEICHQVMVTSKSEEMRMAVYNYLTTEHQFTMPKGKSYEYVVEVPTETIYYLEMALCEMYHSIGIHVNWGKKIQELHDIEDSTKYNIIN